MKRVIFSLLMIAVMMLSTTTALADDFAGGNMPDQGWALTGNWISNNIPSGAMVEDSGTATHPVHTGASGEFQCSIQFKYGNLSSHTAVGVQTADGRTVTIDYNPADVSYYANVNGNRVLLGHDWRTPYEAHYAIISSTDGKIYKFKIGDFTQEINVGSVPTKVYVQFDNNGAPTAHNLTDQQAGRGSGYNLPVLYRVTWASAETPVPVASIDSITPTSGDAPLTVNFEGSATNNPTSFDWDFGDGSEHGSGEKVSHLYTAAGTYTVTLIASNIGGPSEPVTTQVVVNPEPVVLPDAPVASIDSAAPASGDAPLTVNFEGSATNNPTSFDWNFGDGSEHGSGASVSHTYDTPGTYYVTLIASNEGGNSAAVVTEITVTAPVVIPEVTPTPIPAPGEHIIDQGQAIAFCQYQFYSPDSTVTYDGKGGYTVSDPRKINDTTVANPTSGPTVYAVSGQVISAADNKPIADASVVLDNAMQKTNANGEFKFDGVKAGNYDLAVSADGFVAKTDAVSVTEDKLVSIKLDSVVSATATSASAANETANMTTTNATTTDSSAVAGNATATPTTARSPGFEFITVLAAILIVAGVLFFMGRKN